MLVNSGRAAERQRNDRPEQRWCLRVHPGRELCRDRYLYLHGRGQCGGHQHGNSHAVGLNDAPEAADDSGITDQDTVLQVPATEGVLVNDTDPDGADDQMSVVGVAGQASFVAQRSCWRMVPLLVSMPMAAMASIRRVPCTGLAAGETTTLSISYVVEDADGGQDTGLLTVMVEGVDDAPIPQPDSGTTTENGTLSRNLLVNDDDPDDIDADALRVAAVNGDAANVTAVDATSSEQVVVVNGRGVPVSSSMRKVDSTYNPSGAFEFLADNEMATDFFTTRSSTARA
ncbi:MAG: Ig-like domain-containing protein [Gammaproteobacteria bacterium]|nr:Ig-like domain-containing protein [Gammaproteobacteria bacterium]